MFNLLFGLPSHEQRVILPGSRAVGDLFGDLAERKTSPADLLLTVWFRLDRCMVYIVDETFVTVDLGCGLFAGLGLVRQTKIAYLRI